LGGGGLNLCIAYHALSHDSSVRVAIVALTSQVNMSAKLPLLIPKTDDLWL